MLTGILAFTWHDAVRKFITGGSLSMKIGAKVKIIIAAATAVVILSGSGVIVWRYQQSALETSDQSVNQSLQKASLPSSKELSINNKAISDTNTGKSVDYQKADVNNAKVSDQIIAPTANSQETGNSNIDLKLAKKIEVYSGLMRLLPAYKQATQSADNLSNEMQSLTNSGSLYDRDRFPEIGRISYGPDGIKVFDKQEKEITDNPEINRFVEDINKKQEEIKLLAPKITSLLHEIDDLCPKEEFESWTNEVPPQRITGVVSWADTGDYGSIDEYRLAKWLGKELPWDGNTDYKNASDFKPNL
jgi:cell fate (sporulation/competence/biofilm development) regulator YmcA (YheA/YmcA/DUF963 family)